MSDNIEWDSHFTWRIKNFLSCSYKIGETLKSPEITVKSLRGQKWRIWIRPAGEANYEDSISCYLEQIIENEFDKEYLIDYEISLMNINSEILESKTIKNKIFGKDCHAWGWGTFIKIDQLSTEMKRCYEDTLIVRCRIRNKEVRKLFEKEVRTRMCAENYFFEWSITVLPNGMVTSGKHFFCLEDILYEISLLLKDGAFEINICNIIPILLKSRPITGKITLLDKKGNEVVSKSETHTFDSTREMQTWIFPSLITKKQLEDNIFVYEANKKITFLCEFLTCKRMNEANCLKANNETFSSIGGLINLSYNFRNLLSNQSTSDVKLRVSEEKELQAHRVVLAAQSPVFSAMFDREMRENRTGIVDIEDVDSSTFESFLEFLYTGLVDSVDYDKATKLLLVADKYQVPALKEVCVIFLISSLSNEKVCHILMLADMVSHENLKILCMAYITENVLDIFSTMEWAELVEKNPKLSIDVTAYIGKNCKMTIKHS